MITKVCFIRVSQQGVTGSTSGKTEGQVSRDRALEAPYNHAIFRGVHICIMISFTFRL